MTDRPAAELLAELRDGQKIGETTEMCTPTWARRYEEALLRLARAELALAEVEKLPDSWDEQVSASPTVWALNMAADNLRAALRATQGGQ